MRSKAKLKLWIGTSGWTYDDWHGPFYPRDVARADWLAWYSRQFSSVEINGSFYRTPSLEAVRAWRKQTPAHFLFAWKASRFITHWKRLNPHTCQNSIDLIETRLKILGEKAGPILFQLPPQEADVEKLAKFLPMLPRHYRCAFEFRHPSWYDRRTLRLLREHDVSLCISDHHDAPAPWTATASHVYVRGHGPDGRYRDNYPEATLRAWAAHIRRWQRRGKTVFAFFDNDQKSAAPADARRLADMLGIAPKPFASAARLRRSRQMQASRVWHGS